MSKDNVIDFNTLKNSKQKKSPAVPDQEEAELSEMFSRLAALPAHMQEYIGARFIHLMMFTALATRAAEMLKNAGYDPEDFEPEPESADAFLCSGPYLPEDEDQDYAWNGPLFDAVKDGVTYRVAATIEPEGKDGINLALDLLKREGDDDTWQIFADGEWQPGPPDEYFEYMAVMRNWPDGDEDWDASEDWDDDELPQSVHELDLSSAVINALVGSGIETVEELCGKTAGELLKIKGIGKRSIELIEEELDCYGLSLKA